MAGQAAESATHRDRLQRQQRLRSWLGIGKRRLPKEDFAVFQQVIRIFHQSKAAGVPGERIFNAAVLGAAVRLLRRANFPEGENDWKSWAGSLAEDMLPLPWRGAWRQCLRSQADDAAAPAELCCDNAGEDPGLLRIELLALAEAPLASLRHEQQKQPQSVSVAQPFAASGQLSSNCSAPQPLWQPPLPPVPAICAAELQQAHGYFEGMSAVHVRRSLADAQATSVCAAASSSSAASIASSSIRKPLAGTTAAVAADVPTPLRRSFGGGLGQASSPSGACSPQHRSLNCEDGINRMCSTEGSGNACVNAEVIAKEACPPHIGHSKGSTSAAAIALEDHPLPPTPVHQSSHVNAVETAAAKATAEDFAVVTDPCLRSRRWQRRLSMRPFSSSAATSKTVSPTAAVALAPHPRPPVQRSAKQKASGFSASSDKTAEPGRPRKLRRSARVTASATAHSSQFGELQVSDSAQVCEICCTDTVAKGSVCLECGHGWYCLSCLQRHAQAQLDKGAVAMQCPQCSQVLAERNVRKLLDEGTVERFLRVSLERAVSTSADLWACPTPDCTMRVAVEEGAEPRLKCSICKKVSCLRCGAQPYHRGRTCEEHAARGKLRSNGDQDEALLRKWMEETGTKQCPSCRMGISKFSLDHQLTQKRECHKMICRNCGTRFCFKCLSVLMNGFSCGCSIDDHGFLDPFTGERVEHIREGRAAVHRSGQKRSRPG